MTGYTKLFNSILTSTIWSGQDSDTKVIWITMLACADRNGVVDVTLPGLAKLAEVPLEKTRAVLDQLEKPDSVSRTLIDEGRRIKRLDRGWILTNYKKYRNARDYESRKQYMRKYMREYMQKKRENGKLNVVEPEVKQNLAQAEAYIEYEDKKVYREGCGEGLKNSVKQINQDQNQDQNQDPKPQNQIFQSQELRSQPMKCMMPGCNNQALLGSHFCSAACMSYAEYLEHK